MDLLNSSVKICRVCGDKAIGFNFNGLTCESCKSFFRRNALKYEKYLCRKEGSCLIDFVTRKCCTKCRLDKCFANGMKKELICSKLDRTDSCSTNSSSDHVSESSGGSPKAISALQLTNYQIFNQNFPNIEKILDKDIRDKMTLCTEQYINENNFDLQQNKKQILIDARRHDYLIELNTSEQKLIAEIAYSNECAEFYEESRFEIVGEVTDLIYALNLAELYIKKTIKFCKGISTFRGLNQEDQLVLLKDFFTEMMIVRFGYVYDPEKDALPVIENEELKRAVLVKLNLLYEAKKQNFLFYCRQNLYRLHELLENDPTIRDLILVIRLFKPRENVSCPEFIRYQYCVYERLLHRYLEHKYRDANKAMEKVNHYTAILSEVNPARAILDSIFVESDSSQLSVILNEVYNR